MANENKQGQGQGQGAGNSNVGNSNMGNAGKSAGGKPFDTDRDQPTQPGLDNDQNNPQGYNVDDIDGPAKKQATADTWRDRRDSDVDSNQPKK